MLQLITILFLSASIHFRLLLLLQSESVWTSRKWKTQIERRISAIALALLLSWDEDRTVGENTDPGKETWKRYTGISEYHWTRNPLALKCSVFQILRVWFFLSFFGDLLFLLYVYIQHIFICNFYFFLMWCKYVCIYVYQRRHVMAYSIYYGDATCPVWP